MTLTLILLTVLITAGILFRRRAKILTSDGRGNNTLHIKELYLPAIVFITGIFLTIINPLAIERVDASGVGFKVHLTGDNRGLSNYEYKTGWVIYNTWFDQFKEIPTFQQHIEYDTIKVTLKGGFTADIKPSFNYSVIPSAAGDMYVHLRKELPEIEQGWLKNAIYSSVNDIANKWAVDSIFNYREQFEASIITECNKRVSQWFIVSQLRSNIAPPKALQASIEAKTKAIQDVQVAENQRRVAVAVAETNVAAAEGRAKTKIADARGDSAQVVINANAQAAAIQIQQKQLTPLYIDWVRATQWNGALPTTTLGSSGTLFNLK